MKTGPTLVFWTYSGPNFGPEHRRYQIHPFLLAHAKIEALLFVVGTNEGRHTSAYFAPASILRWAHSQF